MKKQLHNLKTWNCYTYNNNSFIKKKYWCIDKKEEFYKGLGGSSFRTVGPQIYDSIFVFATVPPSGLDEYKYRTILKWLIPPTYYHINECQHYTNVHKTNKKWTNQTLKNIVETSERLNSFHDWFVGTKVEGLSNSREKDRCKEKEKKGKKK